MSTLIRAGWACRSRSRGEGTHPWHPSKAHAIVARMPVAAFDLARAQYAELGVDVDAAMAKFSAIPISIHCWQGDDVGGFEIPGAAPGGGLAVTGNYPGKARTPDELRADVDQALALIPGRHRFNLHASYAEIGGQKVDRNAYTIAQFQSWID